MVRLKQDERAASTLGNMMFQFLYGAIKTVYISLIG